MMDGWDDDRPAGLKSDVVLAGQTGGLGSSTDGV